MIKKIIVLLVLVAVLLTLLIKVNDIKAVNSSNNVHQEEKDVLTEIKKATVVDKKKVNKTTKGGNNKYVVYVSDDSGVTQKLYTRSEESFNALKVGMHCSLKYNQIYIIKVIGLEK